MDRRYAAYSSLFQTTNNALQTMHRVNPQEYSAYEGISATDPVPAVELRPHLTEIQEEYDIQNETCFVRTAAQFYLTK
jgi:hypothetical protein